MKTIDELDRLHAAATAGEWESVLCDAPHVNDEVRMVEGPVTRAHGKKFVPVISRISPRADADFIAAAKNAWPSVSARLRAAEALVAVVDDVSAKALVRLKAQQAEVERLRGALALAQSVLRALADCDDAINAGGVPPLSRAEVAAAARAALGVPHE